MIYRRILPIAFLFANLIITSTAAETLDITNKIQNTKLAKVIADFPNSRRKLFGPDAVGRISRFIVNCDQGENCKVEGTALIENSRAGTIDLTMQGHVNRTTCILTISDYSSSSRVIRLLKRLLGERANKFLGDSHKIENCEQYL